MFRIDEESFQNGVLEMNVELTIKGFVPFADDSVTYEWQYQQEERVADELEELLDNFYPQEEEEEDQIKNSETIREFIEFICKIKKPCGYVARRESKDISIRKELCRIGRNEVELGLREDQFEEILFNVQYYIKPVDYSRFWLNERNWLRQRTGVHAMPTVWMAIFNFGKLNDFRDWEELIDVAIESTDDLELFEAHMGLEITQNMNRSDWTAVAEIDWIPNFIQSWINKTGRLSHHLVPALIDSTRMPTSDDSEIELGLFDKTLTTLPMVDKIMKEWFILPNLQNLKRCSDNNNNIHEKRLNLNY